MRQHSAPRSGRSFFGLLSVLALLALACFVPVAQADAPEIEYRDATPSPTGANEIPSQTKKPAHVSRQPGDTPNTTAPGGSEDGQGEEHAEKGGVVGDGHGNGQGPNGSGNKQGNQGTPDGTSPGSPAQQPGNQVAAADDGGSSPLVPILIALAVLCAAAIAAVVIRQRRQRGGADGHVSPEAS
jgi:hypothetical protein